MKIYTCKDRLEDIMTCIYDAWIEALQIGHDQIQLKKEPIFQTTLLDEYIHVDGDSFKAEKVTRSIRRDISSRAYLSPQHRNPQNAGSIHPTYDSVQRRSSGTVQL